jgi:hypothetical protein
MNGKRHAPGWNNDLRGDGPMRRRRFAGPLVALLGTVFVLVTASAAAAATVTVTPANGTAAVGQTYCVTATVTGSNSPTFAVEFTAEPTSGPAATPNPAAEVVPADSNGQAQFCFTSATPGEVLITATARATNTESRPQGTATVTFVGPTDKDQCKQGGWQTFGIFKNQGDCVSFVATGGKNP